MRETRADTRQALLQALVLHAVLFALMFAGLRWTRDHASAPAAGEVIEADLVDPSALSAPMQRALRRQPEQPAPTAPQPEQPAPTAPQPVAEAALPPPVPDPAPVEQPAIQRDAPAPEVAQVPREQEARRKPPPQADLDAQREAAAERERQRKLAEVSRQLAQARRERTQAEMRAQQLEDARSPQAGTSQRPPPPGNRGTDASLLAQYKAALQQAIARQWTRPESVPLGQTCKVAIRQLPGGDVVSAVAEPSCPYDELGRRSVEAAVLKASPLPYAGFEDVFARMVTFNFQAEDR